MMAPNPKGPSPPGPLHRSGRGAVRLFDERSWFVSASLMGHRVNRAEGLVRFPFITSFSHFLYHAESLS